jgi:hypothetical protein
VHTMAPTRVSSEWQLRSDDSKRRWFEISVTTARSNKRSGRNSEADSSGSRSRLDYAAAVAQQDSRPEFPVRS